MESSSNNNGNFLAAAFQYPSAFQPTSLQAARLIYSQTPNGADSTVSLADVQQPQFAADNGLFFFAPSQPTAHPSDVHVAGRRIPTIVEAENEGQRTTIDGKKKMISPFAPEATVPLPFQLDEFGTLGTTVWKRNERERYRVRCVNEGYERLRRNLPLADWYVPSDTLNGDKRLSKVDTLRLAILYIRHLEHLLVNIHHNDVCTCFDKYQPEGQGSS